MGERIYECACFQGKYLKVKDHLRDTDINGRLKLKIP
jgi:hypothetical protein